MNWRRVVAAGACALLAVSMIGPVPAGAGTIGEATSVEEVVESLDYRSSDGDILRLYQAFFRRLPDVGGARYWIQVARDGNTLDEIAGWFADSEEFRNTYGAVDDRQFLAIVYENVLGRGYDQGGFDYWLGLLEGGLSRGGVVRWVAANNEFVNLHPFEPDPRFTIADVARVTDGDTIRLWTGERIRPFGWDSPEPGECGGAEAATRFAELLGDAGEMRLATDPVDGRDIDGFGRSLRHIDRVSDGVDIGLVMAGEGWALKGYDGHTRSADYAAAIERAKLQEVGIWGVLCAVPVIPESPPLPPEQPPPPPPEEPTEVGGYPVTSSDDRNCGDFSSQATAQAHYRATYESFGSDTDGLDGDDDGVACEGNPSPRDTRPPANF